MKMKKQLETKDDTSVKLDTLSKFYSVINKPLHYILGLVVILPCLMAVTFSSSKYDSLYVIACAVAYTVVQYVLYIVCRDKGKKEQKKLNTYSKVFNLFLTVGITSLVIMAFSFISVVVYMKGIALYWQSWLFVI